MGDQEHRWVLSGGIGCGKSTVRRLLEEYGFRGIDADSVGHEVLEPNGAAFGAVSQRWPEIVVDGVIDRASLGQIVFADPDQLKELEAVTHPHIFGTILTRLKDWEGPVVVEVPLIGHGLGPDWGQLIVDCDDTVRLARLADRGMSRSDAELRMAAQPRRGEWLAGADLVVPNQNSVILLEGTVGRFARAIREWSLRPGIAEKSELMGD